jgi:prevent-host-death family protein
MVRFLVYNRVMKMVNINEAKARLSSLLAEVEEGEVIVLCRRNVPVAEISRIKPRRRSRRPFGLAKGKFEIPRSFFDPLPDSLLDAFEGED